MLSVSNARQRILEFFQPVETVSLSIDKLAGRVLSEDVVANIDLPLFDNSSVDGFAVRHEDVSDANASTPEILQVVSDIRAGTYSEIQILSGQCARIMTGAPLPPQADAVVMVEDTNFNVRDPGTIAPVEVEIHKAVLFGENVRRRGNDLQSGQLVLPVGRILHPQDLGLLAMLGQGKATVYRKPRVALLSSGDELIPVDAPISPGKIHDSNSYVLAAACESAGVELIQLGVASDSDKDVRKRLMHALEEKPDVIISSAGVSVGAFDYVKSVIESDGRLEFWKVNMRPGKPLAFGNFRGIPFFGLPGNPVSAYVSFEVFVRPALEKMIGKIPASHPSEKAILAEFVESDGRESYLRSIVTIENGKSYVRLTGHQGSGNLLSLVQANALLIVPSGVKSLPAGSEVEIWPIV